MKRLWIPVLLTSALLTTAAIGCNAKPPSGDVRSSADDGDVLSETRPGGDTSGIGTGTGGQGSGPTGTGGAEPADNPAIENNPD
ncbi:MAG TPA: hypothetical protein VHV77_15070 [Pirellulales bacterium]|jgi:hypothetical protein|nr:hypothetical protein [Pirellulales bacterium]